MKTLINTANPPAHPVRLGVTGENNYHEIEFDISEWKDMYPNGIVSVIFKRPDGEIYPVMASDDGDKITWIVSSTDLSAEGPGAIELRIVADGVIGKSSMIATKTVLGIGNEGSVPTAPAQEWVQMVMDSAVTSAESADAAVIAKNAAESAVGKTSFIGENNNWWEWNSSENEFTDSCVSAVGMPGLSAYQQAVQGGYSGTEESFEAVLANTEYAVHYNEVQSLTESQKKQVLNNIGAEKKSGDYELIETITVTEDLSVIERTAEPDGTPYALKYPIVTMKSPDALNSGARSYFLVRAGTDVDQFLYLKGDTSKEVAAMFGVDNGAFNGVSYSRDSNYLSDTVNHMVPKLTNSTIVRLRICAASNCTFHAGLVINIYDRR